MCLSSLTDSSGCASTRVSSEFLELFGDPNSILKEQKSASSHGVIKYQEVEGERNEVCMYLIQGPDHLFSIIDISKKDH